MWKALFVRSCLRVSHGADAVQRFAVLRHIVDQILQYRFSVLHCQLPPKKDGVGMGRQRMGGASFQCGSWESMHEVVQHLAVALHCLDEILLHSQFVFHNQYLQNQIARKARQCFSYQKRSERIRLFPCCSIALTRSCFMEIFLIAIPPYNMGGKSTCEFSLNKSCKGFSKDSLELWAL